MVWRIAVGGAGIDRVVLGLDRPALARVVPDGLGSNRRAARQTRGPRRRDDGNCTGASLALF
jgi:hypothetical protein